MPLAANLDIVYNPFFIAMGTTIQDFLCPEFVLVGAEPDQDIKPLVDLYRTLHEKPVIRMSIESAELTKVAYNTIIGSKIVIANTMMEICHKIPGADVDSVMGALKCATDRIISPKYMDGGMGDGGGCHPRDNIAMSFLARRLNLSHDIFNDIMICREDQTRFLINLIKTHLRGNSILILGKAFKPETNLIYGSPALLLFKMLTNPVRDNDKLVAGIDIVDPYIDDVPDLDRYRTFFVATKHSLFTYLPFPKGSVVIDPFRYMPEREGVDLVRVGIGM